MPDTTIEADLRPGGREAIRWAPVFLLFFLPAISVELLSGNVSLKQYVSPPVFITLNIVYGAAAILIRETVIRWRKGFGTMMILASGYGMVNEGLASKGFFNPHFYAVKGFGLEGFGRAFGINIPWAVDISVIHAVFSMAIPIVLVGVLFPGRARWLGRKSYLSILLLFAADALFMFHFIGHYQPNPGPLTLILALLLVVILLARVVPSWVPDRWRVAPSPPLWILLGAFASLAFFIVPRVVRSRFGSPSLYIAVLLLAFVILPAWLLAKAPPTSDRAKVALVSGLLLPMFVHALSSSLYLPLIAVLALLIVCWWRSSTPASGARANA